MSTERDKRIAEALDEAEQSTDPELTNYEAFKLLRGAFAEMVQMGEAVDYILKYGDVNLSPRYSLESRHDQAGKEQILILAVYRLRKLRERR
jgi:hypothetical protein